MRLTKEQKRFYAENGFLAVEDLVPPERIAAMRAQIEALCEEWASERARRLGVQQEANVAGARTDEQTNRTVRKFASLVADEPIFMEHARSDEVLDVVEELIGTPIALYADQALLKPPRVGSAKLAHQDNAYFKVEPAEAVLTAWCALDDATVENGCLHYVAGSHKEGPVPHRPIAGTPHLVPDGFDPGDTVAVPIRAGGVLFHHALVLHYSPENRTDGWRRAFVCHYVGGDARTPGKDPATLLRVR